MTVDIEKLEALAKSFPELDFDSNTEPFFNGPSGESLGGGSTGFYCVYGQPFEIDGDQYDGNEYVSTCTKEFAEFMCAAKPAVLELLANNKSANSRLHEVSVACATVEQERDQLKAENAALRNSPLQDLLCCNICRCMIQPANRLQEKIDLLMAECEALRVSLRAFTGSCYPVSTSIDERGYRWSEAYLDQALEMSKEISQ